MVMESMPDEPPDFDPAKLDDCETFVWGIQFYGKMHGQGEDSDNGDHWVLVTAEDCEGAIKKVNLYHDPDAGIESVCKHWILE